MKRMLVVILSVCCAISLFACEDTARENQKMINEIQDQLYKNAGESNESPGNSSAATSTPKPSPSSTASTTESAQGNGGSFLDALFKSETEEEIIEPRYTMAFFQSSSRSEWEAWYRANTNTVQAAAAENNIALYYTDSLNSMTLQIASIQQVAAQTETSFDVMVFSPLLTDSLYWEKTLEAIQKTNVYTVAVNKPLDVDASLYSAYVGPNYTEQGEAAAQWLMDFLPDQSTLNVLSLCGDEDDPIVKIRQQSFAEALEGNGNINVSIREEYINDTALGGKECMEGVLQEENSAIDVVFAHNDIMAIGAIEAINATEGLESGKDIIVISVGASKDALDAILTGTMNASVENSADVGELLIEVTDKLVAGEAVPQENFLETRVFDVHNVKEAYATRLY